MIVVTGYDIGYSHWNHCSSLCHL